MINVQIIRSVMPLMVMVMSMGMVKPIVLQKPSYFTDTEDNVQACGHMCQFSLDGSFTRAIKRVQSIAEATSAIRKATR